MNYTPAQQEAISARGSNLLVSAAAGSGKTAVLAARIVSLAKESVPLDRMLVMTFTRAAAAEMRARILDSLYQEGLREQALRVERADITTLHGFCGQICRRYFEAAQVDPMYRVGEGPEISLLKEAALSDALESLYDEPTPGFAYAALCMPREQLETAVDALYVFLLSRPDPWEWLAASLKRYDCDETALLDSPWADALCAQAAQELCSARTAFRRVLSFCELHGVYEALAQKDYDCLSALCAEAERSPRALLDAQKPTFARKPPKPKDSDPEIEKTFSDLRNAAKKAVDSAFDSLAPLRSPRDALLKLRESKILLSGIADAARRFDRVFADKKAARNVLDFSDLESRALRALDHPDVQKSVREKYQYVFIDEYQDSSLLQEALLSRVRGERNLFLVGDVKQSIYRFRLAEPGLFLDKLRTFSFVPGAENRKLSLNANFRSDPAVLYAVNDVFDRVFCGGAMELEYPTEERLAVGVSDRPAGVKPELLLLCSDSDDETDGDGDDLSPIEREKARQEAEAIARRIEALREENPSLRLRDIAILMRSVRGRAPQMIDVLRAHGLTAVTELGEDLLAQPEVLSVLAILRVMDNARQDIPLLGALRGPALGLDDAALARIRERTPDGPFEAAARAYCEETDALGESLRQFYARLARWTEDARVLPLERILYRIYDETGLYALCGTREGGAQRQNRLRMLAELAAKYESERSAGLSGFLRMVERIAARESLESRALADDEDVIRVTTIHKSKGLQYPVVFVAGAGNRFMGGRKKSLLSMHDALGVAAPSFDPYLRARSENVASLAVNAQKKAESVAEESRILYVALTRAEKRLFVVGTAKQAQADEWQSGIAPVPCAANCLLDWVAPVAFESADWTTKLRGFASLSSPADGKTDRDALFSLRAMHAPAPEAVTRRMFWQPPALPRHPLKQGVTARVRVDLRGGETDELPRLQDSPRRPAFLEETGLTGTERGNAVHAFLQCVDFSAASAAAERDRLLSEGRLTAAEAASLPLAALNAFLASPLAARMHRAVTLRREWAFNYRLGEGSKRILLQGVIDCCFIEDGEWVLVDYKTEGREVDAETLERYTAQLRYYRRALEAITGTPVRECLLCFLMQRKLIDVSRETI